MPGSQSRVLLALTALFVLTIALKLCGISYSLPHAIEPDSHLAVAVGLLRSDVEKPNKKNDDAQYPLLVARLGQIAPMPGPPKTPERTLDEHLAAASRMYVLTRIVVALLASLIVPAAFLFARNFVPPRWALLAAALCAGSLLHQLFAQQARPHAAITTMMLFSVVASMRMRRTPTVAWYGIAGVAAALAVGTLQSGLAVLIPGLVAHFTREGPRSARDHWKLAIPIAVILASVPLFHPFLLASSSQSSFAALHFTSEGIQFSKHILFWSEFDGTGGRVVLRSFLFYEPALIPLLAAAFAALALGRSGKFALERIAAPADLRVALAFALPYLAMLVIFASTFDRFVLPLVPYAVVFAVWGAWQWSRPVHSALVRRTALAAAAVAVALHAATSVRLAWLRTRPDTLQRVASWLQQHAQPQTDHVFVSPMIDLPLPRTHDSLFGDERFQPSYSRWSTYQTHLRARALPEPLWDTRFLTVRKDLGYPTANSIADDAQGYVRALGPGWYVYDATAFDRHPSMLRMHDALAQLGHLELRSAPIDSGLSPNSSLFYGEEVDESTSFFSPWIFPRMWQAHALGPVVEVWRVEAR
jgi:hypothetical protein